MTTKKRTPAARRRTTTRSRTPTRRTTTRRTTTRKRTSTASTLGTAVGAAVAGVLAAALGGLPWWGWVLLLVVGLVAGLAYAAVRGRRAAADPPAAEEPTAGPPGSA